MQIDKRTLARFSSYAAALIMILVPFHAFLTVWGASLVGHYTALRLWDEVVLVILGLLCVPFVWSKLRGSGRFDIIWYLITAYVLVQVVWGTVAYLAHGVSAKALGYGWIVNLRFLLFFVFVWLVASRDSWLRTHRARLLLVPAALVVIFGVLQFLVLPQDFMKHFGYGPSTIPVYETIDHKVQYPRIGSTLRGSNPLGAYLVIVCSTVLAVFLARYKAKNRWQAGGLLALSLLALLFSFSRSAWLGAALALVLVAVLAFRSERVRRMLLVGAAAGVVVLAAVIIVFRHNSLVENTFFHTDQHSHSAISSNAGHVSAFENAGKDLLHQPLGKGPGTAGPASVYNLKPARFAENYYLQIGQETGWIGLILFIAITTRVLQLLWRRRADWLAAALFASMLGLIVVNLLSHAWTDDTLAYVWWGFAAIVLAARPVRPKKA